MLVRLLPPADARYQSIVAYSGRKFNVNPGGSVDVQDFDVSILRANGWILLGPVGTTAQRPMVMPAGFTCYVDTSLNKPIFHDGTTWRDHTGAVV